MKYLFLLLWPIQIDIHCPIVTHLLMLVTVSARSLPAHCWPISPGLLYSLDLCCSGLLSTVFADESSWLLQVLGL